MSKPMALNDDNFETEVLKSDIPVLVDFWAGWCGPCLAIAPAVEELANEYEGKITVGKVDVDKNMNIATAYGIRSIPTLFLFNKGKLSDSLIGAVPKSQIKQLIDKNLNQK
jgi:thioredoxin 1